ncbi:MAG: metal-sulfur cluster assembly factor [Corynebacterium sp.]|uniref:metal-sulfur cluster assembly factor n=1 Tax=unclassified Corynebacterium TaxID=2624378 RepID=UPI002649578E|nr:metal-sulfur cluster assembly factor [Corynebacterium sp.]MDN5580984.1 metal-sulfur cluster assembly factor [Corynebacterium sp.]MDN5719609.1 metal-sulfur cluster assembly factor [Corynebacterium sp.]MDN6258397.1 metal-sulfur cluster assembly factor [Corynebacterium sp.]MDN6325027.1 metal-sulfur cluster assembly factor [Corynebacterium sp.]MDN6387885.1 metal-sulfur cluster assembly factor [Corynebacterium sp.]
MSDDTTTEPTSPQMDPNPLDAVPEPPKDIPQEDVMLSDQIEEAMLDVIDPELGINVVDLGLVYQVWVEHTDVGTEAVINMTLTSPACPLTDMLEDQANTAVVDGIEKVSALRINWVWSPPWGPHMINADGREQLRYLGFSV